MENMGAGPDVFEYRDYRAFLRALYAHRKLHGYGFSLRAFSRRADLRSPNYLKLVMDGDRNLTSEMAGRFADACGLSGQAADYFCDLVAFNQARTAEERERAYGKLRRFRRYREVHRLDRAQEAYYSEWYIPAIRELCARPDFREDPKWIAQLLRPKVTPTKARRALSVLLELGLLARDDDGKLRQTDALVETGDGPLSHHVVSFHRAMLERATEALDRIRGDERMVTSLTLCLSDAQLQELRRRLDEVREEFLQEFQTGDDARRVVQVNFQMFPLSGKED